jgi:hypothetical protein
MCMPTVTVGSNYEEVKYKNVKFVLCDVGGQVRLSTTCVRRWLSLDDVISKR